jgi:hypothetical protein
VDLVHGRQSRGGVRIRDRDQVGHQDPLPRETCALTRLSLPDEPPPAQLELVLDISTEPNDAAEPAWPVEALMRIYYPFYKT